MQMNDNLVRVVGIGMLMLASAGCKDLTQDPGLPAGTPDPAVYNTADGAVGLRVAAVFRMNTAIPRYLLDSGLLSDELVDVNIGSGTISQTESVIPDPLDERILPEGISSGRAIDGTISYPYLQNVRASASLALSALAAYDTAEAGRATQRVMRGELYALSAYAEILLAELFCSGVPLSTVDFQHDFTYAPSSSATQVYGDAKEKLDSALALTTESDSVLNMVRVLKGRAYIDLGNYTAAADDVVNVPTGFQYRLTVRVTGALFSEAKSQVGTVADQEGGNGLPFLSSDDPRVATTVTCEPPYFECPLHPSTMATKYAGDGNFNNGGYSSFVVANGIEARLIQAEAQLQSATNSSWLVTLNQLRESIGLSDTTDPGTAAGRVALLFHERAYWLFLTGHRQGDLRRLIRQYGARYPQFRSDQSVYPSGTYTAPGTGRYGSDVNVPIPTTEYANPNYHGCLDRNA